MISFSKLWEEEEASIIRREENMGAIEDQEKKIPQAMRNMKNSTLEELLIHLSIWIRNDAIMNEEDDEAEDSRRSIPMKQIKYSIVIILFCYAFVYI